MVDIPENGAFYQETLRARQQVPPGARPTRATSRFLGKESSVTYLNPRSLEVIRCLLHGIPVTRRDADMSERDWDSLMVLLGSHDFPYLPVV